MKIIFFILYILMRCTIIHASDDEGSPIMLNPITVTAESKNSFQTGDVDTQEVSSFYSIIKKEDIDGKMTDLADILKKEASIQIQRSTGLGSYSTMSIRGSSADQVIVYMDGILLNNASGGGVDLSNISISEIESIEIYRGTTPINFSQSSIGGVVNIKTNRIKKGSSCSIKTGYGDYHTLNFNSFINHKPGKWDCIFSYDHFASDNNYEISLGDNTDNPFDDRVEDRKSDDFYQNSYLFKMGYDFSEQFRVEFLNNHFSKTKFIPDAFNRETNSKYKTDQNSSTVKITTDNNQSLFMSINLSVSLGDDRYDDPSDKVGSTYGLGKQQMAYHTYDYNFNYFSEWLFTKHILRLTLDARKEKYNQVNEIDNTEAKCYRKTYSVGFQNTFFLLNQKLHIMPALRLEFVKDMNDQSLFRSKDKMVFNDIQKQNYFVPQLGIKYQLFESCSLKSNIGKYFRQPSFFERYSDRGHFQGNPTLEAEEGVNFDVGIEVDYYCQFEWLERFSFDAAYYESDISNFIAKEYDSSGTGRYTNLANGKIDGIETMINIDFLYLFNFNFNAVWQDPINLDEKLKNLYEGDNTYKNLPGSVEKSYLTRLETRFKGFKTYLEYIRQSGLFYDSPNNLPKSKNGALKKELNAGISYSYQSLLLTIDFNNINNNQYDNISYYGKHPNPGRTVFYSLKYEF